MAMLFIKEDNLKCLIPLVQDPEERSILLTFYLLMVDTNRDNDDLTEKDIEFCNSVYDRDKVQKTLNKWFVGDEKYERPLVKLIDYYPNM